MKTPKHFKPGGHFGRGQLMEHVGVLLSCRASLLITFSNWLRLPGHCTEYTIFDSLQTQIVLLWCEELTDWTRASRQVYAFHSYCACAVGSRVTWEIPKFLSGVQKKCEAIKFSPGILWGQITLFSFSHLPPEVKKAHSAAVQGAPVALDLRFTPPAWWKQKRCLPWTMKTRKL